MTFARCEGCGLYGPLYKTHVNCISYWMCRQCCKHVPMPSVDDLIWQREMQTDADEDREFGGHF